MQLFFNVTIDTLLNFKIELSDEEVINIFMECEKLFSSGQLDEAVEKSKKYILKYPYSYYLKLKIGSLFTIYSWKSPDKENGIKKMIGYSMDLFEDVAENCNKTELAEHALFQLGALYPSIDEEDKAIEALNKIHKSQLDPDVLMANIYMKKKEFKKAREILQSHLYKSINDVSMLCSGLANSYMEDENALYIMERYYNLAINVKKALSPDGDAVLALSFGYLNFAQVYLKFNEKKKAMHMLQEMIEDIRKNDINKLGKFSSVWCFNEIPQGKLTITMNLYENIFKIFEAPDFDLIRDSEEFISIVKELRTLEGKSLNK